MIRRYRKRPVVIEALQYDPNRTVDAIAFCGCGKHAEWSMHNLNLVIHTLEGDMVCSPGDFIIKGVKGEFYPCKPDIFALTYEETSDAPS
jgi:hypothetical protein